MLILGRWGAGLRLLATVDSAAPPSPAPEPVPSAAPAGWARPDLDWAFLCLKTGCSGRAVAAGAGRGAASPWDPVPGAAGGRELQGPAGAPIRIIKCVILPTPRDPDSGKTPGGTGPVLQLGAVFTVISVTL